MKWNKNLGTPLLAKEIVKLIDHNNFKGFGFRPTQPSPSVTFRASLTKVELCGVIDSQAKE